MYVLLKLAEYSVLRWLVQCLLLPYFSVEKKEDESIDDEDDDVIEMEEPPYLDDPKDRNYFPHSQR